MRTKRILTHKDKEYNTQAALDLADEVAAEFSEASDCIQELKKSLLEIGLPEDSELFVEFKKIACSTFVSSPAYQNFSTVINSDDSGGGLKKEELVCIGETFLVFLIEFEIIALHAIMSGISAGLSQFLTSTENDLGTDEN